MGDGKPDLNELMEALYGLRREGKCLTLLGVGPMSRRVIRCALRVSGLRGFPLKLIASRNQIDYDGGYVEGLTQASFGESVRGLMPQGHHGWVYLCGDHYGPGRKEGEQTMPYEQALEATRRSCLEAVRAGWDLLHLDPTLDPAYPEEVPAGLVVERTKDIWSWVEDARKRQNLPPVSYEVGSEPTSGRLTGPEGSAELVRQCAELRPAFVVGHVGPHIKMDINIGGIDLPRARRLSEAIRDSSRSCGFAAGLKVHNVDYSPGDVLKCYPYYGIMAANVAPEFGVAETKAYLALAGKLGRQGRAFVKLLGDSVLKSRRYVKWLLEDVPQEAIRGDARFLRWVTEVAGHYELSKPDIAEAVRDLLRAAGDVEDDPPGFIDCAVEKAVGRYVECLGLEGSVELLRKYLSGSGGG